MHWNTDSSDLLRGIGIVIGFLLIACGSPEESHQPEMYVLDIPEHFPEMLIPEDNPMTVPAVSLGKALFFDPSLSKDYSISCASCHFPEYAFSDTVAISSGVDPRFLGFRNSYPLSNVGFQKALFMEGGVPNLELQVLAPMGEASEMSISVQDAMERLSVNEQYQKWSQEAYDRELDLWVITRAIAAYERTLISANAPWDGYLLGDENAVDSDVLKGYDVFVDKGCEQCHSGVLFTDQGFHNVGLEMDYDDPGRARLTHDPRDSGAFKTPSLRNVELTAPYMHDGSMRTLEAVLEHFASGGVAHPRKDSLMRPFVWEEGEKESILAFLYSLTDERFVQNEEHLP
jgi:cytochrome c peroxidase